ncbi:nucleotide-diphosphate-sugar epimerase [Streptomyces sp. Y2F8-2]|uniref:SDR family oxidoreductase n=1 Tax=Streptomyces sp. Y2F8-2 TaxID=2759675 RepID=UPI001906C48D|nr:NAD(P)H-binding protein [Streptomyces sp. Y2F8-2]GHK06007.1 nucleotide-diphosphate-sugar epimerase [Streptomyces sp. Y2F8-2]
MTVLVTGSRGAVARTLIGLLRERGFAVGAASSRPDGPDTVRCDLTDPSTFATALKGVTSVFLYAEPSRIGEFAQEATDAGVEHVVLLSSAAVLAPDAESSPVAKSHLDVEKALDASCLHATSLRPGSFASNALAWRWSLRSGRPISLPFPGSHSDPVHECDIAEAALAVLSDPALGGRPYTLTGPQSLTFTEQIDILSRVTGRSIPFREVTREEWKEEMAEHVPAAFADSLLDWWQSNDGCPVDLTPCVQELTGHPARTFATWTRDHVDDFRA